MNETRFLKYSFPRVSLNLDEVNPQAPALVSTVVTECQPCIIRAVYGSLWTQMPHSHYQWSARDSQSRKGQEVNGAAFAEGESPLAGAAQGLTQLSP